MADTSELTPLQTLLLALGDDEFILGYRDSEWTGFAPMLEEDVAFSSMSQDEIGHARLMYQLAAPLMGTTADRLAYARKPEEFLNCRLVEHPRGDWAYTVARQFLYDTADQTRLEALADGSYEPLASAAQKILREEKYHLMHGDTWMTRLAGRTGPGREHLAAALEAAWPDAMGIFEELPSEEQLLADRVLPASMADLRTRWLDDLAPYFQELDLPFPAEKDPLSGHFVQTVEAVLGGRHGKHTDDLRELWEEMTSVYRLDPEAVW